MENYSYIHLTVHHLDIKRDQLDVTCFFISLFNAQHVFRVLIHPSSGACDLFVELFHGLYHTVTPTRILPEQYNP
jgi:hypothetical protein